MSRVAKKPIGLPKGVEVKVGADGVTVKGPKGSLSLPSALKATTRVTSWKTTTV